MKEVEDRQLNHHDWHGDWNYTLLAVPRPAPPPPAPPPAPRPRLLSRDELARPALTGTSPEAVTALAAALDGRLRERTEHDRRVRHGPRARPPYKLRSRRRLETADYLAAALLKRHLGVPSQVTAAILGVDSSVVRHMIRTITAVLAEARTSLPPTAAPPPGQRIRTLSELREHAARHGIHIPAPEPTPPQQPH